MITGAVLNLILDPVFIFPLGMGVVGAGIATVIGQVAAGVLFLAYLPRCTQSGSGARRCAPPLGSPGGFWPWGFPAC